MATITEDYVSFETAKLLKEKGFTGDEIHKYYDISDEKPTLYSESYIHEFDKDFWMTDLIMAPTLQMVIKWLREVHKIFLNINFIPEHFCFTYRIVHNGVEEKFVVYSATYEQACEATIKYCLEKLI